MKNILFTFIMFLIPNLILAQLSIDRKFSDEELKANELFKQEVLEIQKKIILQNKNAVDFNKYNLCYIIKGVVLKENKPLKNEVFVLNLETDFEKIEIKLNTNKKGYYEAIIPVLSMPCFVGETNRTWRKYLRRKNPRNIEFSFDGKIIKKKNEIIKIFEENLTSPIVEINLSFN